jgi:hypothetical protein
MVASVHELLAAARGKYERPPSKIAELSDIINQGISNYQSAKSNALSDQDKRLDLTRKLVEQQVADEAKKREDEIWARQEAKRKAGEEAALRKGFSTVQAPSTAAIPADRLAQAGENGEYVEEFTTDKGRTSSSLKRVEPAKPKTYAKAEYFDEKTRTKRIGAFDSTTGQIIRSPNDLMADSPTASGLPTPQPGYRWKPDGTAVEPIPGSKPAMEVQEAETRNADAKTRSIERARRVVEKVDQALPQVDWNSAGMIGNMMKNVGGTDAFDLNSEVETIQAILGFKELQEMRDASKTGGALGQVAVRELDLLQATLASMKTGQSPAQLRKNLGEIKNHFTNWLDAVEGDQRDETNDSPGEDDGIGWSDDEEQELRELEKQFGGR